MNIHYDTNTIYAKEQGYCRIKMFDLNTEGNLQLGTPELQPADSFLISYVHNDQESHVLLDAGKKGQGEHVIIPYLKQNGIYKLDKLILSHMHYDHFGGMIDILNDHEISVEQIIYAPIPDIAVKNGDVGEANYRPWQELMSLFTESASQVREIAQQDVGNTIQISPELYFTVIAVPHYQSPPEGERTNLNNLNLVLKLHFKQFTALFPGDCGIEQSNHILSSQQSELIKDVFLLKASHHGGDDSTTPEFVALCNPKMVIMTCNITVVDHRPSFKENVHLFARNGAKLYRADHSKSIDVYTDGSTVECIATTDVFSERTVFKCVSQ